MKATLKANKRKVTDWVNTLEDETLLNKVMELMNESSEKPRYDGAYAATLTGKDKIAYWESVGISGEELKKRLLAHVDSLPWKK